jgi:hypothetical protein
MEAQTRWTEANKNSQNKPTDRTDTDGTGNFVPKITTHVIEKVDPTEHLCVLNIGSSSVVGDTEILENIVKDLDGFVEMTVSKGKVRIDHSYHLVYLLLQETN